MQINITGHHVDITQPIREYIDNKLSRIQRHIDNITSINVILTVESKILHKADAEIHLAGANINAGASSENLYAAIDALVDKLDRQIAKYKGKGKTNNRQQNTDAN